MIIYVKRPSSINNTIIMGGAVLSIEIAQQLTDDGTPEKFSLIILGAFQRQWFVAEREKGSVTELESIRDNLLEALKKEENVEIGGDDPPKLK
jgi:hypothetical protein